jgi:hypothetical protein
MENQQEGEQMHIGGQRRAAESPSFPNPPLLAAGGAGVGWRSGA